MSGYELYVIDVNGQLCVNWEALELISNEEFVETVKEFVHKGGYELAKIESSHIFVSAWLRDVNSVVGVRYSKKYGRVNINTIGYVEFKRYAELMGYNISSIIPGGLVDGDSDE